MNKLPSNQTMTSLYELRQLIIGRLIGGIILYSIFSIFIFFMFGSLAIPVIIVCFIFVFSLIIYVIYELYYTKTPKMDQVKVSLPKEYIGIWYKPWTWPQGEYKPGEWKEPHFSEPY